MFHGCILFSHISSGESGLPDASTPAVFVYGRLVLWLVLALMLVSIGYAGWHVLANWNDITV